MPDVLLSQAKPFLDLDKNPDTLFGLSVVIWRSWPVAAINDAKHACIELNSADFFVCAERLKGIAKTARKQTAKKATFFV